MEPEDVVFAFDAVAPVYSLQARIADGGEEAPELQDFVAARGGHENLMLKQALERLTLMNAASFSSAILQKKPK